MAAADGYLLTYSLQQQRGAEVADNSHRRGAPADKPPGFAGSAVACNNATVSARYTTLARCFPRSFRPALHPERHKQCGRGRQKQRHP